MNRRGFLRVLGIGAVTAPALAKIALTQPVRPKVQLMSTVWFQTTRVTSCCSPAYLAALNKIFETSPTTFLFQ